MKNKVTMGDIAKQLNISTVTVSKALSDKDGVGNALRLKIRKKAEEMGYVYNSIPLLMKEGKTYNIGILVAERFLGTNAFYWQFYKKLLTRIQHTRYFGILEIVSPMQEEKPQLPDIINKNKVDGFIVLGQFKKQYLNLVSSGDMPCVFLDFFVDNENSHVDYIVSNNFHGGYNITNYLINLGHKNISFVGSMVTNSIIDRYMGYSKAMIEHKLSPLSPVEDRDEAGQYINLDLNNDNITAYVCNNDQVARSVIETLTAKGKKVPDDVSVTGFDNSDSVKGAIGITTMEVDIETMCAVAVDIIINKMNPDRKYNRGRTLVECKLIEKDSCKKISQ